ncbi:Steroid 5-alpha reductase family enzyme [Polaribacter sp. Hel1_33_78]|nr:Steroid 5-alpha reductase family enzyme [Polaribacter sp. Hel1_33_78]
MNYIKPLYPYIIGCIILMFTTSFAEISVISGSIQLVLFGTIVLYPIWKTETLSYVDIGWPWGLVCIGLVTLFLGEGYSWRVWGIGALYILMGLRMGIGAIQFWLKGYIQKELPRYRYQRIRWERKGKTNIQAAMQIDALVQGLANVSYLALPAFIIASNPNPNISVFEVVGLLLWVASFILESIADKQKLGFLRRMKTEKLQNKVCEIGLWKYTRHPNYFAEWTIWNSLIIISIPSWLALRSSESLIIWVLLGLALLFVSIMMYNTLVYLTGAIPSEYYSLQKRPNYKSYTKRVNMFFPGFRNRK